MAAEAHSRAFTRDSSEGTSFEIDLRSGCAAQNSSTALATTSLTASG